MTGVRAPTHSCMPNGLVADSIHRGKLVGTQRACQYLSDLFIIKAGLGSAPTDPAPLKGFTHILGVRSRRQVTRLNTHGPVATMQNMQASGYIAVKELVTDPVGVDAAVSTAVNPTVPVSLQVSTPVPAPILGRRFRHNPSKLLLGRKAVRYGHRESLLRKHTILRFIHLTHPLTVGRKRAMVNE